MFNYQPRTFGGPTPGTLGSQPYAAAPQQQVPSYAVPPPGTPMAAQQGFRVAPIGGGVVQPPNPMHPMGAPAFNVAQSLYNRSRGMIRPPNG